MKLIDIYCKKCGHKLTVNAELDSATCNYCGYRFNMDNKSFSGEESDESSNDDESEVSLNKDNISQEASDNDNRIKPSIIVLCLVATIILLFSILVMMLTSKSKPENSAERIATVEATEPEPAYETPEFEPSEETETESSTEQSTEQPAEQANVETNKPSSSLPSLPNGTWETASNGYEFCGEEQPEYYVQFGDGIINYGHKRDGIFVLDHSDKVRSVEENSKGGIVIQAENSAGQPYTFQTSEEDADILEYFSTWDEAKFADSYSGSSSLFRSTGEKIKTVSDNTTAKDDTLFYEAVYERLLTDEDLTEIAKLETGAFPDNRSIFQMIINEIYARHGLIHYKKDVQEFFEKKGWYKGKTESQEAVAAELSQTEKANVLVLRNKDRGNLNPTGLETNVDTNSTDDSIDDPSIDNDSEHKSDIDWYKVADNTQFTMEQLVELKLETVLYIGKKFGSDIKTLKEECSYGGEYGSVLYSVTFLDSDGDEHTVDGYCNENEEADYYTVY